MYQVLIYSFLLVISAVIEVGAVLWARGVSKDQVWLVVFPTMFLAVVGYLCIRVVVQDEMAIIPSALGHGLGAYAGMRWVPRWFSRPKDHIPEREQDPQVPMHLEVMRVVPDRDPSKKRPSPNR